MKSTMTAEQARKKVKGQDQMGSSKKSPKKSNGKKSMSDKGRCCCGY